MHRWSARSRCSSQTTCRPSASNRPTATGELRDVRQPPRRRRCRRRSMGAYRRDGTFHLGALMIARIWHGSTTPENADAYESHLKPELLPGLSEKNGFRHSYLLRRTVGGEVEFITIILFDSLDDVREIAGPDYERAVIPADRVPLLSRYDAT